jgi:Fe-S-cluster containining protein
MGSCSTCGECCRWLVFRLPFPKKEIKNIMKKPEFKFSVNHSFSEDELIYFKYRLVSFNGNIMIIPNKYKEKTRIMKEGDLYSLYVYIPCSQLTDTNKCGIWDKRPEVCDYTKVKIPIWKPPCCTDK